MAEVLVGIDLGTTNSEVAAFVDGEVCILGGKAGEILPSCVALDDAGKILVGAAARNQMVAYPERTVVSVKRLMGAPAQVRLGDQTFKPQEISAFILKELKRRAEIDLGQEVKKAVITVPAYFSDAQRAATQEAGALAGLEVVRILNEPTAASLAYGLDRDVAQTVLIYDLGGGTFDVSLVRIEDEVTEVLASHGDNHLGGDDFDRVLVELFLDYLEEEHGVDLESDDRAMARLRRAAEQAKVRLSTDPEVQVREEHLVETEDGSAIHLDLHLTRADFEDEVAELIDRTILSVDQVLSDAELEAGDIDQILLVGGSTRIPLVSERLQERLGKAPRQDLHPDLCVALGAGVLASRIGGHDVERILVDVTPYSFGPSFLGDQEGRKDYPHCYRPIIRRNTPLPVSHTELYRTSYPDQREIDVRIYQGDDEDALNNILVGRFRVDDLTPQPAFSPILCRMDLDVDGILHVTITEKSTGKEKKTSIEGALRTLSTAEVEEARARLEGLLREDLDEEGEVGNGVAANGASDELVPQARQVGSPGSSAISEERRIETRELTAKVNAVLDEMGDEDREEAEELLRVVARSLELGEESTLDNAVADLNDLLFYVEQR